MGRLVSQFWRSLRAEGPKIAFRRMSIFVDHVVRAARAPAPPAHTRKLCLFVAGCPGAPRRYRCEHLAEQLALSGYTSDVVDYPVALRDLVPCYRVFVLQRVPHDEEVEAFMALARQAGKPVLFDVDDLVIDVRFATHLGDPRVFERYVARIHRALALADAALVATERLRQETAAVFPATPVFLLRNAVSAEMVARASAVLQGVSLQKETGPEQDLVLGYFSGSPTHARDLATIVPALVEVLRARQGVRLLLLGEIALPAELETFRDRIQRIKLLPWQELPHWVRKAHVNLVPLEPDNPFTAAKSEIKWLEASLVERPTVASAVGAMQTSIRHGIDGFLCATTEQWRKTLLRLIDEPELRLRVGREARAVVEAAHTNRARSRELVSVLRSVLGEPQKKAPSLCLVGEVGSGLVAQLHDRGIEPRLVPSGDVVPPCNLALLGGDPRPFDAFCTTERVLRADAEDVQDEVASTLR